jgi:hypothetical protein
LGTPPAILRVFLLPCHCQYIPAEDQRRLGRVIAQEVRQRENGQAVELCAFIDFVVADSAYRNAFEQLDCRCCIATERQVHPRLQNHGPAALVWEHKSDHPAQLNGLR